MEGFWLTVNREIKRSSKGVSFKPPFLALVRGVRTASVMTCMR